jgi:tetratricopeptide (TPR) repeat protein
MPAMALSSRTHKRQHSAQRFDTTDALTSCLLTAFSGNFDSWPPLLWHIPLASQDASKMIPLFANGSPACAREFGQRGAQRHFMSEIKTLFTPLTRFCVALCFLISISSPPLSVAQSDSRNWNPRNATNQLDNKGRNLRNVTDATGSIVGEIRSLDNRPVQNARVKLQSLLNKTILFTVTDADGNFEFRLVPNGSYILSIFEGLHETTERIDIMESRAQIELTIGTKVQSSTDGEPTVSINQLGVPDKAREALQKALEAWHVNRLADADKYLDKALASYPRYAVALTLRGLIASDGHPELACEYFQKAIEYDPNYAPARLALGSEYNRLGRFDDAARTLDRALAIAPTSWQGYYELSVTSLGKGDFKAALRFVEKASSLVPIEFPPMHVVKGYALLGLQNKLAASTELTTFLREAPDSPLASRARQMLESLPPSLTEQ